MVDAVLARLRVEELELGLVTEALERLRPDTFDARHGGRLPELGERRDAVCGKRLRVPSPKSGDEHEVIVVDAPLVAEMPKVADRAVLTRPRIRRWLSPQGTVTRFSPAQSTEKPLPRPPKESDVVRGPKTLPQPTPKLDVHLLGQLPLDPLELLCVEAELENVERLGGPGKLRIHGLVRPVGPALEKIRKPAPSPIREVRLVNNVGLARPNRLLGRLPRRLGVEPLVLVRGHAQHPLPGHPELLEVRELVKVPLLADEGAVGVLENGPLQPLTLNLQLELRQMRTREVVRQIGGREPKRAVSRKTHVRSIGQ